MCNKLFHCQLAILNLFVVALGLAIFVAGAGCSSKDVLKIAPKEYERFSRDFIDIARKGDLKTVRERFAPEFIDNDLNETFYSIQKQLNRDGFISLKLVNYQCRSTAFIPIKDPNNNMHSNVVKMHIFEYQLHYKNGWQIVQVIVRIKNNNKDIYGFRLKEIPKSVQDLNAIDIKNKPITHLPFILFFGLIPIFIIYCFVLCLRTKIRLKWLWLLFILFGVGQFSFNWSTGEYTYRFINIQLLGTGMMSSGLYGPWIIILSVPAGAIAFLIVRSLMLNKAVNGSFKQSVQIARPIPKQPSTEYAKSNAKSTNILDTPTISHVFCRKCGSPVDSTKTFCVHCGTRLKP